MSRGISDFALRLVFRDWNIFSVIFTGIGLGAAIIAHQQTDWWTISHTAILVVFMIFLSVLAKCISFAFSLYQKESPRLHAERFVRGDGLNAGNTIIVLGYAEGFSKGQLLTLFCESSGARQPILVLEITAVNEREIQAVPIVDVSDQEIRKYFEEESRRQMLFAEPKVTSGDIVTQRLGARNE